MAKLSRATEFIPQQLDDTKRSFGITAILALGLLELQDLARNEKRQLEAASSVVGEIAV